jgi:hypothetical protein
MDSFSEMVGEDREASVFALVHRSQDAGSSGVLINAVSSPTEGDYL